jgi:hypothetical protein
VVSRTNFARRLLAKCRSDFCRDLWVIRCRVRTASLVVGGSLCHPLKAEGCGDAVAGSVAITGAEAPSSHSVGASGIGYQRELAETEGQV